jgi:hypothetical protein
MSRFFSGAAVALMPVLAEGADRQAPTVAPRD